MTSPAELYARSKKAYPHDRVSQRRYLDELLVQFGYRAPQPTEDQRPTMSTGEAARALGMGHNALVRLCKAKKVAARSQISERGNRSYRPYVDEIQRIKEERHGLRPRAAQGAS